jgi:hypothetical protein
MLMLIEYIIIGTKIDNAESIFHTFLHTSMSDRNFGGS